jgi:hypothetical protein
VTRSTLPCPASPTTRPRRSKIERPAAQKVSRWPLKSERARGQVYSFLGLKKLGRQRSKSRVQASSGCGVAVTLGSGADSVARAGSFGPVVSEHAEMASPASSAGRASGVHFI